MSYETPILTPACPRNDAEPRREEIKAPLDLMRLLLGTLSRWHQRSRQRRALAELDDRLLKDVGLTRTDVEREIHKPFWQR